MKHLGQPGFWFPVALLVVAALGSAALQSEHCRHLSERDRTSYGMMPVWRARFDAMSATCGVGLMLYDLQADYTPTGRWVLVGLGLAGALLYLTAARQVIEALWSGAKPLPRVRVVLAAFLVWQILAVLLAWILERASGTGGAWRTTAWNAIAAFASLGWLEPATNPRATWIYAFIGVLGALGWTAWLLPIPALVRRYVRLRSLLVLVATWCAFLAVSAALITALEMPRGAARGPAPDRRLAGAPTGARYARSLVQVAAAASAGMPTEELKERGVSEGTKVVLSGVVLVGGLGGAAGGGIRWPMLLALLAVAGVFGRRPAGLRDEGARRGALAAVACVVALVSLVLVVALGLLVIEARTTTAFQSAPTLGDALLDATSAVAGGNLSSGLMATVTSANLSRGIHQSVDLYQYGLVWLLAAMFISRTLPVLILARCAAVRGDAEASRLTPTLI